MVVMGIAGATFLFLDWLALYSPVAVGFWGLSILLLGIARVLRK